MHVLAPVMANRFRTYADKSNCKVGECFRIWRVECLNFNIQFFLNEVMKVSTASLL